MIDSMTFHHMGVAVKEFETSLEFYTLIGYKKTTNNPIRDNLQKVDLYLLEHDLHPRIELVKPYEKDSPVNSYLKKTDNIIYHYCYEVKNFEQVVTNLKEKFRIFNVSKPKPAILFDNRLVTFYYINNVGLIELLENEK